MKNNLAGVIFFAALFWAMGVYSPPSLPPNAPEGAVEYFETHDGGTSVVLFEDKLVMEGADVEGGFLSMPLKNIKSVKKFGNKMIIRAKNGDWMEIEASSSIDSRRFRRKIDELRKS